MTDPQTSKAQSSIRYRRAWTNTIFTGHWPVGSAAVVWAYTAKEAAEFLEETLEERDLPQKVNSEDMIPFPDHPEEFVRILCDGNY